MHVHIVAVSGAAMAPLAGMLVELGHTVSGSDVAFDPPMGPALAGWGVRCYSGFSAKNLEPRPDLVVVGNVCRRDNVEAVAAFELGLEVTHVAGALQRFVLAGTTPLVVAGTHGKTTTTSLCAWLLDHAGLAPGFLIGGIAKNFDRGFRIARPATRHLPTAHDVPRDVRQRPFVIEGDEYDTAYFEKTPKFIHYHPQIAIITSIEHDHIDIYPRLADYLAAFRRFIELVPEAGLIVANGSDAHVVELVEKSAKARVSYFAIEGEPVHRAPHWLAAPARVDAKGTSFDLYAGGVHTGRYFSPLHGHHNLKNVISAIGACAEGFNVRLDSLQKALWVFSGVKRRQELLGTPRGAFIYDDFAHHPTAVSETLKALRARHPGARLFAVFEPRSATACRRIHQEDYALSFSLADQVLLAPLGRDLPKAEALDREHIASELVSKGRAAFACASIDEIVEYLALEVKAGDVVALLSNGGFGGIHQSLVAALG